MDWLGAPVRFCTVFIGGRARGRFALRLATQVLRGNESTAELRQIDDALRAEIKGEST